MPQPTQRLTIFGPIGSEVTSEGIAQQLGAFDRNAPLLVEINSDGGAVQEGVAIYNLLRAWPGGVEVEIVGWALSVATVIAMAGRVIRMHPTSLLMVHAPWLTTTGNASELRSTAQVLDQVSETMRQAYSRTGREAAVINAWLDGADHWFTADQALEQGLVHEVITGDVRQYANASGTRHPVPPHLLERIKTMPQPTPPQAGLNAEEIRAAAVRAEADRRKGVRAVFGQLGPRFGDLSDLQRQCEDDIECNADAAGLRILAQVGRGATPAGSYYSEPGDGRDYLQGARDALLMRAGFRVDKPNPMAQDLRHASVVDIAASMLRRRGQTPVSSSPGDIIRAAMSTSDLPALLANVASNALRIGYSEAPVTHTAWTGEKELPDFKPATLSMLSEGPDFELKGEGAEYRHGALWDSATSFSLQTYGKVLALTREALINDRLDAFTDIPRAHGASARRLEGDKVYGLLTSNPVMKDGNTLFHAAHGNLAAAGTSVSLASLGIARAAMRVQKGIAGSSFIDPQPRFLIVPVVMETFCEALLAQLASANKGNDVAPDWVRSLTLVSDPRLDAVDNKAWYLAASPTQIETIVRAYLATGERPHLDEYEDKNTDSMNFKARLDFCVGVVDYRGLYKNPGA